jgi:hypothetical protein
MTKTILMNELAWWLVSDPSTEQNWDEMKLAQTMVLIKSLIDLPRVLTGTRSMMSALPTQ